MRNITVTILGAILFFISITSAFAQSGCCSWHGGVSYCDTSVGRKVCNDGTYSPSCTCPISTPIPTPTPLINSITASTNYDYSIKLNKYSIKFDWQDIPYSQGYSVSLTKYPGADPGPLIDTQRSVWRFNLLSSGIWYANLKSFDGYSWSPVVYWTINLLSKTSINQPIITSTPIPTKPPVCNCAKTCTQISTCAEAYYQLNNCGCSVRDGDNDGIPCENLCR